MDEHRSFAITAAMISGTGLMEIKNKYSDRLVDVGIAEEYAVTFLLEWQLKELDGGMYIFNILTKSLWSNFAWCLFAELTCNICNR